MYEGYFDGYFERKCGAGGEDGSEGGEAGKVTTQGEMEAIEIDKTSFLETFMVQEFIMTSRIGFASLKRHLVQSFAEVE